MDDEPLDTWFKREILAHEAALVRCLTRTWRDREEILDLRQEIYIRVYEAASNSRPRRAIPRAATLQPFDVACSTGSASRGNR